MRALLIAVLIFLSASNRVLAANDDAVELYLSQVKPVLAERCFACHGALKQEAGLRLDTVELMLKGGDSGSAIKAAHRTESLILQRVSTTDSSLRMPHEGEPLKPQQIEAIGRWIDQNAPAPKYEQAESDPRDHWAFKTIVRPEVPSDPSHWSSSPVDNFISTEHRKLNLQPQESADNLLLVRRLYLDLVGILPNQTELSAINFQQPNWYDQLVSRLLEDQRYGERWARHWMDVWRYSDWWGLGDQLRNSQYHMWHWRDWIIQSLNQDLPYDEMIRQMLAADEIYPEDLDRIRATGFLARNYFLFNRNPWMEETVEHVSKSLLGLTMNCTKCHDHKFDPFEQADFYRMRAFFEPYHVRLDMLPGETDLNKNGLPRVFDIADDSPTFLYNRGDENQPDKSAVIAPGVPKLFDFKQIEVRPVSLPQTAWQPEYRKFVIDNYLAVANRRLTETQSALATFQARLEKAQHQLQQAHASAESSNSADATKPETSNASDGKPKNPNDAKSDSTPDSDKPKSDSNSPAIQSPAIQSAEAALKLAQRELAQAECEHQLAKADVDNTQARADWMLEAQRLRAKSQEPSAEEKERIDRARVSAITARRQLEKSKAELSLAKSELNLIRAKPEAIKNAEAEIEKAKKALSESTAKLSTPIPNDEQPEILSGSRWTATRFRNSTADDPSVQAASQSSGRRRALAEWITDARNPLTARVAVNHLWNRHFGTPLVATVFDFGRKGAAPTNQALLDWLARELIESGWSMKHIHRLIVSSSTYRMSSSSLNRQANIAIDPDNKHWWRRNSIRIESQAVRDSVLFLAGELDLTLYGPSIPSAQQAQSKRRSLYFFHSNNDRNQFLTVFDEASVKECYRRDQSIVPQQALALVNSGLIHQSTAKIAHQITSDAIDQKDYVKKCFRVLLGIQPSDEELNLSLQAMNQWQEIEGFSKDQVRQMLVWTLLNHNDFVTLR